MPTVRITDSLPRAAAQSGPLMVKADEVLFSITCVTLVPKPPVDGPIVVAPVLVPVLVTVPMLLTVAVVKATVSVLLLFAMVKLLVPVTPPLNVVVAIVPLFPRVNVPTDALVESTMGRAMVNPVVPTKKEALLLPVVSPKVMLPLELTQVATVVHTKVPLLMVTPPVKVLI